jgi:hypothetical protein
MDRIIILINIFFININIEFLLNIEINVKNKKFLLFKFHRRVLENNKKNIK